MKPLLYASAGVLLLLCSCGESSFPFIQVDGPYELTFTPPDSGMVAIVVKDCYLAEIRVLEPGVASPGGVPVSRTWDLTDEYGAQVDDGLYFVEASLDGPVFETVLLEVAR
jgi:hypothetical protein